MILMWAGPAGVEILPQSLSPHSTIAFLIIFTLSVISAHFLLHPFPPQSLLSDLVSHNHSFLFLDWQNDIRASKLHPSSHIGYQYWKRKERKIGKKTDIIYLLSLWFDPWPAMNSPGTSPWRTRVSNCYWSAFTSWGGKQVYRGTSVSHSRHLVLSIQLWRNFIRATSGYHSWIRISMCIRYRYCTVRVYNMIVECISRNRVREQ